MVQNGAESRLFSVPFFAIFFYRFLSTFGSILVPKGAGHFYSGTSYFGLFFGLGPQEVPRPPFNRFLLPFSTPGLTVSSLFLFFLQCFIEFCRFVFQFSIPGLTFSHRFGCFVVLFFSDPCPASPPGLPTRTHPQKPNHALPLRSPRSTHSSSPRAAPLRKLPPTAPT